MKTKIISTAILMIFITNCFAQLQHLVSEEWADDKGTQDFFQKSVTQTDVYRNVYIAGATLNGSGDYDLLLTKYDSQGSELWTQQVNGNGNGNDFATAVFIDASLNVYVTGTEYESSTNKNDIIVLKYDSSGTLQWSATYNGASSDNDAGGDITVDGSGYVYVTGTTYDNSNQYDFVTIRYKSDGTLDWVSQWDNVGLNDVANKITFNGKVYVAGGTQVGVIKWEYAIVEYDPSSGTQVGYSISGGSSTAGIDKVTDITRDAVGNIYVTGGAVNASTGYDCYTLKLDSGLNVLWTGTYNGNDSLDDVANSIKVDSQGNVYICGYTTKTGEGKNYVTIKYDDSGNEQWTKFYNHQSNGDDEATSLELKSDNEIIVTGVSSNGSNNDYATFKYSDNADFIWNVFYDGGEDDSPSDIAIDNSGAIIVSGQSRMSGTLHYMTVKYLELTRYLTEVNDTTADSLRIGEEIVIKFNPDKVDPDFVNHRAKKFADITEVIPNGVIQSMQDVTGLNFSDPPVKLVKVFSQTIDDSLSVTRLGDTIPMDKFWSIFALVLPDVVASRTITDSLNTLIPDVEYAEFNYFPKRFSVPNDTYASTEQESLIPTSTYPNANINVDPAWDIETGKDYVKVGVYDDPIYWAHEDFGDGTYAGSKIAGGWDFGTQQHISQITNPSTSHGTSCAGIIGALRNNHLGIAGIAGGDVDNASNRGVQLYSFGIYGTASLADISGAIVEGSASWGYGLHIQNHSWGQPVSTVTFYNAVVSCARNNCAFVAARGNNGNTTAEYPACFSDWAVINVGASGTDGEYMTTSNGDALNSSYGVNLDLIAPGTTHIVSAPFYPSQPYPWTNDLSDPLYYTFRGTSSAAPHVAGVAALMMSRHNTNQGYGNNLAPEDVEYILQTRATDKTFWGVGYDDHTGWGLLNAGAALYDINMPAYWITHDNPTDITVNLDQGQVIVSLAENTNGVAAGLYYAEKHKVIRTYEHNWGSNIAVLAGWPRLAATWGTSQNSNLSLEPYIENFSVSTVAQTTTVNATTYTYFIQQPYPSGGAINVWIPAEPYSAVTPYSLLLRDLNIGVNEISQSGLFNIYPNPAEDEIYISYHLMNPSQKAKIEICDAIGQVVYRKSFDSAVDNTIKINSENFTSGLYLCKLITDKEQFIRKIIKQ
jgi:subtilisin family serine protease